MAKYEECMYCLTLRDDLLDSWGHPRKYRFMCTVPRSINEIEWQDEKHYATKCCAMTFMSKDGVNLDTSCTFFKSKR